MVVSTLLDTTFECIGIYACHGVWDGNARQAGATIERTISDACHGVGDGRILTPFNKDVV